MGFFLAVLLKALIAPAFAFLYWLVAVKGGDWAAKTFTKGWLRELLTRSRSL